MALSFSFKGGDITPNILVDSLNHLDELDIYSRGNGLPGPALLLDGHQSRRVYPFV